MYAKYRGRGLEIIALSTEGDLETVESFSKETGMKYPTFLAGEDVINAYGVKFVPLVIIIGKDGIERYRSVGYKEKEIKGRVEELLK